MKVVIKDNWAKNLGDVAIAESMISQVREVFPGCEITLESSHPEITKEYFKDVKVVRRLFDVSTIKYSGKTFSLRFIFDNIPFILKTVYAFFYSCFFVFLNRKKSRFEILNEIKSADLVLSAGGDFLSEKYAYRLRLFEYTLIKKLRKPLILYAQSIGPFPRSSISLVRIVLNKIDGIFARDEKTVSLLKEYGVSKNVYRTADSVILLKINESERAKKLLTEFSIGVETIMIVVRDTKFTSISRKEHNQYVKGMVETIQYISSQGYRVMFLAPNEEDLKLSQEINRDFNLDLKILDTRTLLPSEVKFILSKIKLLISARIHPMIIASAAGTPVISTGHEFKMENYMKLIDMDDYYYDMASVDSKKLFFGINKLLKEYDATKLKIKEKVGSISLLSSKNSEYLKNILAIRKKKIVSAPLISVVIVNWNGKKWLDKCIGSLINQTYPNLEIILVDNASVDDSVSYVRNAYPKVKVIETDSNLGFAGGNNAGIKDARGEYVVLFNNDAWVEADFLKKLWDFYNENDYDVISPHEMHYDKRKIKQYSIQIDVFGHPVYFFNSSRKPFYLSGVCVLFKKQLYLETGGLDDDFFMYFEEIDWFWRLHLLEKKIFQCDDIYIYHEGAGSTGGGIKFNSFLWRNQNTLQMLLKNYAWYNLLWVVPGYLLQNIFEILAFVCVGKPKIALSYLYGWAFNIRNIARTLKKRKNIQLMRQVSDASISRQMYKGPGKIYHLFKYLFK